MLKAIFRTEKGVETDISELGFCLASRPDIPTAKRRTEKKSYLKIDGEQLEKYGYNNKEIILEYNFLEYTPFKSAFEILKPIILEATEMYFTDEPNRTYQIINVELDDAVNEIEEYGIFEVTLEVYPFAFGEMREINVENATTIMIDNNGTEKVYPQFDFMLNGDTHMLALTSSQATYQFGESLEASPLKEIKVTEVETTGGQMAKRNHDIFIDNLDNANSWKSYDISQINPNWKSSGIFSAGQDGKPGPVNGKVTIAKHASHWQTGQRMSSWVKGGTFPVAQTKKVNQSNSKVAYLLKNRGQYLGWLLEQDVAGARNSYKGSIVPSYGSGGAYEWHGPAIRRTFGTSPTDWSCSMWHFFEIASGAEMGAVYISVRSGDDEIASVLYSAHKSNRDVMQYLSAGNKGLPINSGDTTFSTDSYGRILMVKKGKNITFELRNDRKKKKLSRTFTVPEIEDMVADNIVIWCGQYGNFKAATDNRPEYVYMKGLNSEVWVAPKTEKITNVLNVPDPSYTWRKDDMIRIDMSGVSAEVNGTEELTPIAYGSKAITIPPGKHEVIVTTSGDNPPDAVVRFREVYV